jgi:hypothetical protein
MCWFELSVATLCLNDVTERPKPPNDINDKGADQRVPVQEALCKMNGIQPIQPAQEAFRSVTIPIEGPQGVVSSQFFSNPENGSVQLTALSCAANRGSAIPSFSFHSWIRQ